MNRLDFYGYLKEVNYRRTLTDDHYYLLLYLNSIVSFDVY